MTGRSPKSWGAPTSALGEMPYVAMPGAHEVEVGLGDGQEGRGVGDMPHLGLHARLLRVREHLVEQVELRGDGGVPGLVGAGEVRPEAGHLDLALGLGGEGGGDELGPVGGLAAVAAEAGVGLELDTSGPPAARAAAPTSRSAHSPLTDMSRSASMPSRQGSPGVHSQHISRPRIPAARRARASWGVAVPSHCAPAAGRPSRWAPCRARSASDFTTAISCSPAPTRPQRTHVAPQGSEIDLSAGAGRRVWLIAPSVSEGGRRRGRVGGGRPGAAGARFRCAGGAPPTAALSARHALRECPPTPDGRVLP